MRDMKPHINISFQHLSQKYKIRKKQKSIDSEMYKTQCAVFYTIYMAVM